MAVDSHCSRPDRRRLRYGRREPVAVGRRHPRTNCRSRHDDNGLPRNNDRDGTVFDNLYEPGGLGSVDHPGKPRHVHDKPGIDYVDNEPNIVDDFTPFNLFHHHIEFYNHYNNNCSSDNNVNLNDGDFYVDDNVYYDDNDCPDRPHHSLRQCDGEQLLRSSEHHDQGRRHRRLDKHLGCLAHGDQWHPPGTLRSFRQRIGPGSNVQLSLQRPGKVRLLLYPPLRDGRSCHRHRLKATKRPDPARSRRTACRRRRSGSRLHGCWPSFPLRVVYGRAHTLAVRPRPWNHWQSRCLWLPGRSSQAVHRRLPLGR